MRLFLDTSVVLAACGSGKGASREIFRLAAFNRWTLVATPFVVEEVLRNLPLLSLNASADWPGLRTSLLLLDDVLTLDRPAVFPVAKDKPILFSALAWADALLTLVATTFPNYWAANFMVSPFCLRGNFLPANERRHD